jgi:hypothetical protein
MATENYNGILISVSLLWGRSIRNEDGEVVTESKCGYAKLVRNEQGLYDVYVRGFLYDCASTLWRAKDSAEDALLYDAKEGVNGGAPPDECWDAECADCVAFAEGSEQCDDDDDDCEHRRAERGEFSFAGVPPFTAKPAADVKERDTVVLSHFVTGFVALVHPDPDGVNIVVEYEGEDGPQFAHLPIGNDYTVPVVDDGHGSVLANDNLFNQLRERAMAYFTSVCADAETNLNLN